MRILHDILSPLLLAVVLLLSLSIFPTQIHAVVQIVKDESIVQEQIHGLTQEAQEQSQIAVAVERECKQTL
jgi:hypothetical protein